ncbi:MAG: hypothetical protein RL341_799, partial [Pseudomonadota bacterium]
MAVADVQSSLIASYNCAGHGQAKNQQEKAKIECVVCVVKGSKHVSEVNQRVEPIMAAILNAMQGMSASPASTQVSYAPVVGVVAANGSSSAPGVASPSVAIGGGATGFNAVQQPVLTALGNADRPASLAGLVRAAHIGQAASGGAQASAMHGQQ